MIYYTYVYKDPITLIPRYIGKGKNKRAYIHSNLKRISNKSLQSLIQNLQKNNLNPIIDFIAKDIDEEFAFFIEKEAISLYGRKDLGTGSLFNHTNGGEGQCNLGRHFGPQTNEHKLKISLAQKGVKRGPQSLETIKKRANLLKGKPWSEARRNAWINKNI